MPVGSVTAYAAGLDTSTTAMSYALESAWATLPAVAFQGMRINSSSMKHVKTRTRPPEIRGDRQAAPGLTTQEAASGTIVFPVFYSQGSAASQFDDFMSCLFGGDWQAATTISSAAADIIGTVSGGNFVLTAGAGKWTGLRPAQLVKLLGFTNAVNNSWYRVLSVTSTVLTLVPQGFTPIAETPAGTTGKVYYSNLQNGQFFKSIYFQERLDAAATKFFRYPGSYPTKGALTLNLGQFFSASFDFSAQQELKALVDASTGAVVAAPNTKDYDPVGGFKGVYWNDTLLSSAVDQLTLTFDNAGAAGQMGLGSALAQGMLAGTFTASGSLRAYFKDYIMYDSFRAETPGVLSIRTGDQSGNSYSFTMPNTQLLMNNGVTITGPNTSIMAVFDIEASPDTVSGCTVSVDRFPLTA